MFRNRRQNEGGGRPRGNSGYLGMTKSGLGGNFDAKAQAKHLAGDKKRRFLCYAVGAVSLFLFIFAAWWIFSGDPQELIDKRKAIKRLAGDIERLGGSTAGLKLKVEEMNMLQASEGHSAVWQRLRDTRSTHRKIQSEIRNIAEKIRGYGSKYDIPRGMIVKSIQQLKRIKQTAEAALVEAKKKHFEELDMQDMAEEMKEIKEDITIERQKLEELGVTEEWDDLSKYNIDQLDSLLSETMRRVQQAESDNARSTRQEAARKRREKELAKKEVIAKALEEKIKKLDGTLTAMEKLRLNVDYWEYNTYAELDEKQKLADKLLKRKDLIAEINQVVKQIKEADPRADTTKIETQVRIKPPVNQLEETLKDAKKQLNKIKGISDDNLDKVETLAKDKDKAKIVGGLSRMRIETALVEATAKLQGKDANQPGVVDQIKRENAPRWDYMTEAQLQTSLNDINKQLGEKTTKLATIKEIKAHVTEIKKLDSTANTAALETGLEQTESLDVLNKKLNDANKMHEDLKKANTDKANKEKELQALRDALKKVCDEIRTEATKKNKTVDTSEFDSDLGLLTSMTLLEMRLKRANSKLEELRKAR